MTPAVHTEATFEAAIEESLLARGWVRGSPAEYDRARALDPTHLVAFIEETQPELWNQLKTQHGADLERRLIETLLKFRRTAGTLELLRRGFKFYGKTIRLAYFAPATRLNPEAEARYRANRLVVTRQVKFAPGEDYSVDMALFLNGLPVATLELKNELTGQNIDDAKKQYRRRDANAPLFRFKEGALVHFAVDTERVAMTTRLAGDDTYFLPFDRGHEGGAGNPPHPSGHRTAYLWEEVLARESFLDILGRFMHLQTEERWRDGKRTTREIMLFPRYHQLDVVRKLERAARAEGPGHSYLIQHSAGSGKTNSIAWLAHRLASLHDEGDEKVFHSVVVLTDRTVLDRQLQDAIYDIDHKQGVVERVGEGGSAKSTELAEALEKGVPIIVCTLQTFPFVAEKIGELPSRSYAVIVDEAHSSQTGEAARSVKEVLRAGSLEEAAFVAESEEQKTTSPEDEIVRVMESRGLQPNLSFFAFTATPKGKTLERFGRRGEDGEYRPFHLYTMRQAIEEGFILDVLRHYTTYKTFWRLAKKAEDDPEIDAFAKVFYKPRKKQSRADHARLVKHLGPSVDRFKALDREKQREFRDALIAYVRLYAFLSQVISWADPDLEKRYTFARMLQGLLPREEGGAAPDLEGEVQMQYYRLEMTRDDEAITLISGEAAAVPGISAVGTGSAEEDQVKLSELIDLLNERFHTNFTPADQLFFDQVAEEAKADDEVVLQARANPYDAFALAMREKIADLMIDRLAQNREIVTRFFDETDLREFVEREMSRRIYEEVRGDAA